MLRSALILAAAAAMMNATAAMADDKSDCQKGVAMIKAELKKNHPKPVLETLRKALSDTDLEAGEEDWSECMNYVRTARAALKK
ncbi:MAG TPA: histidine kinase [Bradyrhizobium sp.]|uniref:histidine kinase n=1 Tax=Bradyrhizobium sp. TaxID=376 RepID=UPI002C85DF48|nr:histidine kinase [Bradyrhizobium sp.]HLZ02710.1 histidine kinase [Bradyrhizobium sp.]